MTLRTRSVLGHRLSQRLSSRLGRTAGRKGSAIFDRLGVDDPWASSPRALRGFDLVYLTLPPDDEEELVEEDETAAQLMARMSRQVKRSRAQRRKPSSRRRMLDRIEMTERERPGVRRGDLPRHAVGEQDLLAPVGEVRLGLAAGEVVHLQPERVRGVPRLDLGVEVLDLTLRVRLLDVPVGERDERGAGGQRGRGRRHRLAGLEGTWVHP